jgi:hypothetical protein
VIARGGAFVVWMSIAMVSLSMVVLSGCKAALPLLSRAPASEQPSGRALPAGFATSRLSSPAAAYPIDVLTWQGLPISHSAFNDAAAYAPAVAHSPISVGRALYASHLLRSAPSLQAVVNEDDGSVAVRYLSKASVTAHYDCRSLQGGSILCDDIEFSPRVLSVPSARSGNALIKGAGNELSVQRTRADVSRELSSALVSYAVNLPFRMLVAWNVEVGRFERDLGGLSFAGRTGGSWWSQRVAGSYGLADQDRMLSRLSVIPCQPQRCEQLIERLDPKRTGSRRAVLLIELEIVGFAGTARAPWQAPGDALLDAELRRAVVYEDGALEKLVHAFVL